MDNENTANQLQDILENAKREFQLNPIKTGIAVVGALCALAVFAYSRGLLFSGVGLLGIIGIGIDSSLWSRRAILTKLMYAFFSTGLVPLIYTQWIVARITGDANAPLFLITLILACAEWAILVLDTILWCRRILSGVVISLETFKKYLDSQQVLTKEIIGAVCKKPS